jgi:hypothetical protein
VFGLTVAVKKAAMGCEVWKKLLWVMSWEKAESRLVRNCCEYSKKCKFKIEKHKFKSKFQIWKITEFRIWKSLNFKITNFEFDIWNFAEFW